MYMHIYYFNKLYFLEQFVCLFVYLQKNCGTLVFINTIPVSLKIDIFPLLLPS